MKLRNVIEVYRLSYQTDKRTLPIGPRGFDSMTVNEAGHSPSKVEIKNMSRCPPPPYKPSGPGTTLIKHKDNFTLASISTDTHGCPRKSL